MHNRQSGQEQMDKDMAKDAVEDTKSAETLLEAGERLLTQGRRLLSTLETASRFAAAMRPDGTCPIFFHDAVFHITLPFADFDQLQMRLIARRAPPDEMLLRQIIDLVPSLDDRIYLDVGSYTGTTALILQRFLKPVQTHLFEPQATMRDALENTVAVNTADGSTTVHYDIIDDGQSRCEIGSYRPEKLSEVSYLRRADGRVETRSVDSFDFENVGFVNFDFNNTKVDALKGAQVTIERDRPVVCCDLIGRDQTEQDAFFEPLNYEKVRVGANSVLFLPS